MHNSKHCGGRCQNRPEKHMVASSNHFFIIYFFLKPSNLLMENSQQKYQTQHFECPPPFGHMCSQVLIDIILEFWTKTRSLPIYFKNIQFVFPKSSFKCASKISPLSSALCCEHQAIWISQLRLAEHAEHGHRGFNQASDRIGHGAAIDFTSKIIEVKSNKLWSCFYKVSINPEVPNRKKKRINTKDSTSSFTQVALGILRDARHVALGACVGHVGRQRDVQAHDVAGVQASARFQPCDLGNRITLWLNIGLSLKFQSYLTVQPSFCLLCLDGKSW